MSNVDTLPRGGAYTNTDKALVKVSGSIGGSKWKDITTKEIVIGESLTNPGLMTSITFQAATYTDFRNYNDLKNKDLILNLSDGLNNSLNISNQKVYRLDNRSMMPLNFGRTEEFTVHACHKTLLENSKMLMSKLWKCTTPSDIVSSALSCVKANAREVQQSSPARDYIAENINPFQVIQQQCNVALDGNDPSFIHWMTNANGGTHYFKSLRSLINAGSKQTFIFRASEQGVLTQTDYNNPANRNRVVVFEIPCMFDYLSDLMNGVGISGQSFNALTTFNPMNMGGGVLGGLGNMMSDECFEAANMKQSMTNKGSSQQDYGCETDVESHLLKRQARMGLLERDKIALRITVPWTPKLHAGDKIRFNWFDTDGALMPESDEFIISSLMHKIQYGGFATSSFDCIRTRF